MEEISSGVYQDAQKMETFHCKSGTYKLLGLATVFDRNIWLSEPVIHLEGEVLKIRLHVGIIKLATNETRGVENAEKHELIVKNKYQVEKMHFTCCEGSSRPGSLRHRQ